MSLSFRYRPPAAISVSATISAVLIGLILWLLWSWNKFDDYGSIRPASNLLDKSPPTATETSGQNRPALTEFLSRPLFHASRQPIQSPEMAMPAEPVQSPTEYEIVGVLVDANRHSLAFLRRKGELEFLLVSEGETVDGWQLTTVTKTGIVLGRNGEHREFRLTDFGVSNRAENHRRPQREDIGSPPARHFMPRK